ncbi:ABC transporter substrate-binding protein [Streptomyces sp. NPDC055078]
MGTSRRGFLRAGALAGLALPFGAACGGDDGRTTARPRATGTAPRRGGRLRAALTGSGSAESLHPLTGASPVDFARNRAVYDPLFTEIDGRTAPRLATSATVAPDGKSFRLALREGVRWHDGSPFGARDVVFTLRTLDAPGFPFPNDALTYIDVPRIKITGDRTLTLPLKRRLGDPATLLATAQVYIIKDGTRTFEAGTALGTGAFRVSDFEPGRSATLKRFDDHWDGAPHLDELVFLSLADPQARVSAVRAGQADFAADIPYTAAETLKGGGARRPDMVVHTAGADERTGYGVVLNATKAPFSDPRARLAMRLAVDREELVETILLGHGVPGNDLYGAGSPYFEDREPPRRDVARARRLLRDAGAENTDIVIRSAETENGVTASVTVLAQQLKEAGITVRPEIVTPAEFSDLKAMARADAVTLTLGAYPLQTIYPRLALVPSLTLDDAELKAALGDSFAATGEAGRARAWRTAQNVMLDRGNAVVWGNADTLSLAHPDVRGALPWGGAKYPYLGKAWLA